MTTVCHPALILPENVLTQEELLEVTARVFGDHPRLQTILRIIRNSRIRKRHFVQTPAATVEHPGFEARNNLYIRETKRLGTQAAECALTNAHLSAAEIDMIIVTSCTGFMIPSLDAHLMNTLNFRPTTRRLPIAQLGCSAGASAIGLAHDYCSAHPGANVLIVAVELCSLCFQPVDTSLPAIVSAMIFGDGVAACVVKGKDATGFKIEACSTQFLPQTEHYMGFDVKDSGFHIVLDKEVPGSVADKIVPAFKQFAAQQGRNMTDFDFYLLHPGGARVLDNLVRSLSIPESKVAPSLECLAEVGNLSSASVFAVVKNAFERHRPSHGSVGFLAAFGPGFSIEMSIGTWAEC